MQTNLIFNGNFFYVHSKALLSNIVLVYKSIVCLLCYTHFSASRNGCTVPFCIFGGFPNETESIFQVLYKDNKIIPRRLEG